jgi:hypothetical protein
VAWPNEIRRAAPRPAFSTAVFRINGSFILNSQFSGHGPQLAAGDRDLPIL